MDVKSIKQTVQQIKTNLFRNSNAFSLGMLKSHFRGSGLQFKEHQVYVYGDEIRFIDWKLLARSSNPYIKTFEEERNVEISVIIDASSTMLYGVNGVSKLRAAFDICCLLYLLADKTNDYVHAVVIADEIYEIPKKKGEVGIYLLLNTMIKAGLMTEDGQVIIDRTYKGQIKENDKIASIKKHFSRKREIVLLSDFNDFIEFSSLEKYFSSSHLHSFQIVSPIDEASKTPFSLFFKDNIGDSKFGRVFFNRLSDKMVGKKVKRLNVENRYLEEFVKEML